MAKTPSAGDLDRTITIQRAGFSTNAFNEPEPSWTDFVRVRAMKRDTSDFFRTELRAAGQLGAFQSSRFLIRSSSETRTLTPKDRILYGSTNDSPSQSAIWNIHGIKEADFGRDRFLEVTAIKDADL